jgi:hypothetical protein
VRTSGQTTAQGYFQFYILHRIFGLAHRFLRVLIMTESSEKDDFDTEKVIIEVEIIYCDTHVSLHVLYEADL